MFKEERQKREHTNQKRPRDFLIKKSEYKRRQFLSFYPSFKFSQKCDCMRVDSCGPL